MPENEWLKGDRFRWRGPWGTTYPINLRNYINNMSENQWIERVRTLKARPPMPWLNLNQMKADDVKAIYHFVVSLGPSGGPAPSYVPPEQEPEPPYATIPAPPPK